jgi:SAM-dependent methyltransferase
MASLRPELFYTGIVARAYGPLRSAPPDPRIYAGFVEAIGEPALELGCGDGDPLLDLVAAGLDVEGLDSSPDMLARCRSAAAARGLDVVLHEQAMQSMDLGRRYRSIYLAGPTFNLLPDDDAALLALRGIAAHLAPGGAALVPLFIPSRTTPGDLGRARSHTTDDGTVLRVTALREDRDEDARLHVTTLRYEAESAGGTIVDERPWLLHWYSQAGFASLAGAAGLAVAAVLGPDGAPAGPDDRLFAFRLVHAGP